MALNLGQLNGSNGFRLVGIDEWDQSGFAVAGAGDVNDDGIDDLIVGAYGGDPDLKQRAGETYIIFGRAAGFAASFDLASLDGSNGFRLDGIAARDASGVSVAAAGDVNGDGFDDVILGADMADPDGENRAGQTYVVFGKKSAFAASLDLSSLNGSNGFRLNGATEGNSSGWVVDGAGDVNADGIDDVIVAAFRPDEWTGAGYVVFGRETGFAASLDLSALNGSNGFRLRGIDEGDRAGWSLAGAGDVNGDGINDVIIGSPHAAPDGKFRAGESYVVFGTASGFSANFDLSSLNGKNGFRLDGDDKGDYSGRAVAGAGDINADGFDDLIVGARGADPEGKQRAGESYVVFGKATGFAASLDLSSLDGSNGFRLDGINPDDRSGRWVAPAGDFNGDGIDDLIIGASGADPGGVSSVGEIYLVFGTTAGFAATLDLSAIDGSKGLRIGGINAGDNVGRSAMAAGDVNGDGYDDLIVGAHHADPDGKHFAGESYVIFGTGDGIAGLVGSVLLWRHESGQLAMWKTDGTKVTSDGLLSAAVGPSWDFEAKNDFDGDGTDDILWQHDNGQLLVWKMQDGRPVDGERAGVVGPAWDLAGTGDLNGDGTADLLWRHENGRTALWEMDFAARRAGNMATTSPAWSVDEVADVNGDGRADVVWRHDDGRVNVWEMNGRTATSAHGLGRVASAWDLAATGDFDGDGAADLLWRHDDGRTVVWGMDGTPGAVRQLPRLGAAWEVEASDDYDADGTEDILWQHEDGKVAIWRMEDLAFGGSATIGTSGADWHLLA